MHNTRHVIPPVSHRLSIYIFLMELLHFSNLIVDLEYTKLDKAKILPKAALTNKRNLLREESTIPLSALSRNTELKKPSDMSHDKDELDKNLGDMIKKEKIIKKKKKIN